MKGTRVGMEVEGDRVGMIEVVVTRVGNEDEGFRVDGL